MNKYEKIKKQIDSAKTLEEQCNIIYSLTEREAFEVNQLYLQENAERNKSEKI